MRTAIYLGALILADAVLRANVYYHETEMRWLYAAGVLFLLMDLGDWSRTTWDWLHDKDWKIWRKRNYGKYRITNPVKYRYGVVYRGSNDSQRSGS